MSDELHVAVTRTPLDPASLVDRMGDDRDGAIVLFLGRVRNHHEGRNVVGILYEGYEDMIVDLLTTLARDALATFSLTRAAVEHRLGSLAVGEVSVAVAVSSPHRAQAFDGARWLMDELKARIPVWKKESFKEGDAAWVKGVDPRRVAPPAMEDQR